MKYPDELCLSFSLKGEKTLSKKLFKPFESALSKFGAVSVTRNPWHANGGVEYNVSRIEYREWDNKARLWLKRADQE